MKPSSHAPNRLSRLTLAYWRFFNFMVRRVVAIGFVAVGLVVAAFNAPGLLPGGTISVNGEPSTDLVFRIVGFGMPLLVALLGVALFRVKPYYPGGANDAT